MDKLRLIELLDGRDIDSLITEEEEEIAKSLNILLAYKSREAKIDYRGVISEPLHPSFHKNSFYYSNKELILDSRDSLKPFLTKLTIEAIWSYSKEGLGPSWEIIANVPSYSFLVMEGDLVYCRGLLINVEETIEYLKANSPIADLAKSIMSIDFQGESLAASLCSIIGDYDYNDEYYWSEKTSQIVDDFELNLVNKILDFLWSLPT